MTVDPFSLSPDVTPVCQVCPHTPCFLVQALQATAFIDAVRGPALPCPAACAMAKSYLSVTMCRS